MWNLPKSGIVRVSPELAGKVLPTVPPGKSLLSVFFLFLILTVSFYCLVFAKQRGWDEMMVVVVHLLQLCLTLATPSTATHQPPLSVGFPRQEYWRGLVFPFPFLFLKHTWEASASESLDGCFGNAVPSTTCLTHSLTSFRSPALNQSGQAKWCCITDRSSVLAVHLSLTWHAHPNLAGELHLARSLRDSGWSSHHPDGSTIGAEGKERSREPCTDNNITWPGSDSYYFSLARTHQRSPTNYKGLGQAIHCVLKIDDNYI